MYTRTDNVRWPLRVKALSFESEGVGFLHFMLKVMGLSLFRPRASEKFLQADGCGVFDKTW